jgi:hypothetical protein
MGGGGKGRRGRSPANRTQSGTGEQNSSMRREFKIKDYCTSLSVSHTALDKQVMAESAEKLNKLPSITVYSALILLAYSPLR